MKIKIRHRDANVPEADGWSQMGDWLAELGDDNHAGPPGDGHAEPDGADDPRPQPVARTDAQAAATPAAVMTPSPEAGPVQLAISRGRAVARPSTAAQRSRPRPLELARCSLCGIALPLGLLVPDGGQACADIRWYCKDATSCTARWTTARPPGYAHMPGGPRRCFAGAGEAAPDRAPVERPDRQHVPSAQSSV